MTELEKKLKLRAGEIGNLTDILRTALNAHKLGKEAQTNELLKLLDKGIADFSEKIKTGA
jgi:hypothetical protein